MTSLVVRPRAGSFKNESNRFGMDYREEAAAFPRLGFPIVDAHTHINGPNAARIMKEAMDLYGVGSAISMTALEQVPAMREIFGDRIRFIAIPDWASKDRRHANTAGFLERIERFHALGARIVKFWQAPRLIDLAGEVGDPRAFALDSPARIAAMELADSLGMTFMTHVADPDTWFATRYKDATKYGTKRSHYEPLEKMLDRFRHRTWLAAHFGGWPEDLEFLDGLLSRHPNLRLDTSATKWVVREISKHSPDEVVDFLRRHRGRIVFGSDIVTADEHLSHGESKTEMQAKAHSHETAFDLYASRYWALRMMWEGEGTMTSPIADPDLAMVEPTRFTAQDAPLLRGMHLPADVLRSLYHDAAQSLLNA
ncbi:MAG: amidohydrolase family protein [Phycisphaerales bacterium]